MKKTICILFLLLMFTCCKKTQIGKSEISESKVFIDTNDVYNKKYRTFIGKLEEKELYKLLKDSTQRHFHERILTNNEEEEKELYKLLKDSMKKHFHERILINNEKELVELVEPILFRIYGKNEILNERPYDYYRFGDFWILTGTLPKQSLGGTFNIKINRKTCQIINISHGK